MHPVTNIHCEEINSQMHYLDVYSKICLLIVTAKQKAVPTFADVAILQNEHDRFHFRLVELHDAGKITGLIAMQYIIETQQEIDNLFSLVNKQNNN
jgi:hypothetical protein